MITEEIYDVLIEAWMTNYEPRITRIERDLNLLKWMAGFNLAMTAAILFRVFS